MTTTLLGKPKYSDWVPTSAFRDTGERSGFVTSGLVERDFRKEDGMPEVDEIDITEDDQEINLEGVTRSASSLANMQGVQVAAMPVATTAEREKFDTEWRRFVAEGVRSFVDFDAFALSWNQSVQVVEEGKGETAVAVFRKTAAHLKAYWGK